MIATIAKQFTFDAAHRLERLPADHKCHRMHGHTYVVELVFEGPVDDMGFVLDYADVAEFWAPLHDLVDHRILNEVRGLETPTTENLAAWIGVRIARSLGIWRLANAILGDPEVVPGPHLERVRVHESSTTWCDVWLNDLTDAERNYLLGFAEG